MSQTEQSQMATSTHSFNQSLSVCQFLQYFYQLTQPLADSISMWKALKWTGCASLTTVNAVHTTHNGIRKPFSVYVQSSCSLFIMPMYCSRPSQSNMTTADTQSHYHNTQYSNCLTSQWKLI